MIETEIVQLQLTDEQIEQLEPLRERARQRLTSDLIFAQVRRLNWTEGGHLILEVALLRKEIVEAMRAGMIAEQKRLAKGLAKDASRGGSAREASEGQGGASTRMEQPIPTSHQSTSKEQPYE